MKYALMCYGAGILVAVIGFYERTFLAFGMFSCFIAGAYNTFFGG